MLIPDHSLSSPSRCSQNHSASAEHRAARLPRFDQHSLLGSVRQTGRTEWGTQGPTITCRCAEALIWAELWAARPAAVVEPVQVVRQLIGCSRPTSAYRCR